MSRSAADATRFTATGPYASSKPNGTPYELPNFMKTKESTTHTKAQAPQSGSDGKPETPKQKVERLRAQARAARMAQSSSGVDRWIEVGRRFANKAHKGMVYSLIVASGTCLSLSTIIPPSQGLWQTCSNGPCTSYIIFVGFERQMYLANMLCP